MKLIALSDTHRKHRQIIMPSDTDIDCLVHAGDITSNGELSTIEDFADWLKSLPYRHKLITPGNHDKIFEVRDKTHAKSIRNKEVAIDLIRNAGATYLEHEAITINGVKMFFSPFTPFFFNWAFNIQRGKDLAVKWADIPADTQLLVSHGMPYGILDAVKNYGMMESVGDQDLLAKIDELKELKAYVGGHLHQDNYIEPIIRNGVKFINAALLDNRYNIAHDPTVFEI